MASVELVSFITERKKINIKDSDIPLVNTYVTMEIKGIPVAYINAFRRVSIDELTGYALQVPSDNDWNETTDEFMLPQFVIQRLALVPIKTLIGDYQSIRYLLDIENNTTVPMSVYTGDLVLTSGKTTGHIFNPTFKICILQPGRKIFIKDIYVSSGIGKDNAIYQKVRCGAYKHIDIEEYDKKETHLQSGSKTDYSGYKISSMISNPKHHLFTCIVPATDGSKNEITSIFIDVCKNIKDRLLFILSYIESTINTGHETGIEYSVYQLSDGIYEGILIIKNETHTIGELIKRTIYDLNPDIILIKYIIVSHEDSLKLTIQFREHVNKILIKAIKYIITTFETLQKKISSYKD